MRGFVASGVTALLAVAALASWALDWVETAGPALAFGLGAVAVSVWSFVQGPALRERTFTLSPAALAITPTLVALGALVNPALAFVLSTIAGLVATVLFVRIRRTRS